MVTLWISSTDSKVRSTHEINRSNSTTDVKVLLKRFHLNGHAFGFLPQTQKLDRQTKLIVPCEKPLNSFRLMVTS